MNRAGLPIRAFLFLATAIAMPTAASAQGVRWKTNPSAALQQAGATGHPLLMKFTAEWCVYCKKMERTTFSDPATTEIVHRHFVPLLIDFDQHRDLARQLKVTGLPAILIIAPDMKILDRISGYKTTEKLLPKLNAVITTHRATLRVPALPAAQQRAADQPRRNPFADNPLTNPRPVDPGLPSTPETPGMRGGPTNKSVRQEVTQPSFHGLCLTSVVEKRELIAGSEEFSALYRGQVLYFRDATQRNQFLRTPEKYWPMLDGNCAVTLLETGRQVAGQFKHAVIFRNGIWVFQNRARMLQFIKSPGDHVARIEERQKQSTTAKRSY